VTGTSGRADVLSTYRQRLSERQAVVDELERTHVRLGNVRIVMLVVGVGLVVVFGVTALPWIVGLVAAFGVVAAIHTRVLNARDRARAAVGFYDRGIARLTDRWAGTGATGDRFKQDDHPNASDLDLFGTGGLFELLSTVRTHAGEDVLAGWLLAPAPPSEVKSRQDAARELAGRLALREKVAVLGEDPAVSVDAKALVAWALAPVRLAGTWPRILIALLATASVTLTIAWLANAVRPAWLLGALLIQTLVALWYRRRVNGVLPALESPARDLELVAGLLQTIEREAFSGERLSNLAGALGGADRRASAEIARLARLVALTDSRENQFFTPFAALMMWGTQLAFAVESWRARVGRHVPGWLQAIGEFEALSALSTYTHEHPDDVFPVFAPASPARLVAVAVAHPLLPEDAVPNDVRIGGEHPHLLVISGSNMSGKSTLLRTLGVNVVLAQAGAPVRASAFELSPLAVGATLRIQDSLRDGRSRFMAEITRLRQIVDMTRQAHGAVLFLLDEILAGTNSHDRRHGAAAVLDGLLALGAIGAVTTHDLALGEIAAQRAPAADNVHFEDRFEGGSLIFDYRLRPGVVRTSNALALMRSIGLEV
jgi:MutS domain V